MNSEVDVYVLQDTLSEVSPTFLVLHLHRTALNFSYLKLIIKVDTRYYPHLVLGVSATYHNIRITPRHILTGVDQLHRWYFAFSFTAIFTSTAVYTSTSTAVCMFVFRAFFTSISSVVSTLVSTFIFTSISTTAFL